jgi:solute carrier family 6 GABA transporter-like protein 1
MRDTFIIRDAIITCIVNTLTCLLAGVLVFSILGYMAHVQETTIDEVVNSGPGLVFLTYPDLVLKLPWSVMWACIFFCMLLVIKMILFFRAWPIIKSFF